MNSPRKIKKKKHQFSSPEKSVLHTNFLPYIASNFSFVEDVTLSETSSVPVYGAVRESSVQRIQTATRSKFFPSTMAYESSDESVGIFNYDLPLSFLLAFIIMYCTR